MSPKRKQLDSRRILVLAITAAGLFFAACCACWAIFSAIGANQEGDTAGTVPTNALRLAYSPEKQVFFEALVADFNQQHLTSSTGETLEITALRLEPEAMVEAALAGDVDAIVPDSSIWLDALDRAYQERQIEQEGIGTAGSITSDVTRWAVSPVVIAMWEDTARQMGWPDEAIGWKQILERAQADPDFKWSHPATSSASGLLATLAQFYAGAGTTRGLTEAEALSQPVIDYVSAIQKTVRFYGEGEWAIIERALAEGNQFLDAFVVQEQLVIYFNQQPNRPGQLVAVYPAEGTLWEDHPLALVESPTLTPLQRETYQAFRDYLTSGAVQQEVLAAGYRPADLTIAVDGPDSPINPNNGVDAAQPQTTLQMPAPGVVQIVRDVWWLTKRHTNVYLVVDTSGSMYGDKLDRVKEALVAFLGQIKGDSERVGLIAFASSVYYTDELDELGYNRAQLLTTVGGLTSDGDTALLDAVYEAYGRLQYLDDRERINAIVVMTDGRENSSYIDLGELVAQIQQGNETDVPVVIFCIAYGDNADTYTLTQIANASGGQLRTGDLETIQSLYKTLSTYF